MKGTLAAAILLLSAIGTGAAGAEEHQYVQFSSGYTYRMLDSTTEVNRKQLALLQMREAGLLEDSQMYIGADMTALSDLQQSNTDNKFGYLMRHPTQNNQGEDTVSELVLHSVELQVTGTVTSWAALYFQVLYDPEQSFGSGTITDLERNQLSLRRGYVLLGDLSASPFYASIGKMATPFGLTDTVNPFSASTVWHAFGGLAFGGLIGYEQGGLNLSFMGIQGGAQFRAANSGDDTPDDVANFAAGGSYTVTFSEDVSLRIGGGYQDGSAYCQSFPVTHFDSCDGFKNPAWDAYTVLRWGRLTMLAEFAETIDEWPGTYNPNPPLDEFEAHNVSAFDVGMKYQIPMESVVQELVLSADFSQFNAGPSGSPWEKQSQLVLGLDMHFTKNMKLFAEYVRTEGYVPLNFISGPDPFDPSKDPGTTHSVADAETDVFLLGVRITI